MALAGIHALPQRIMKSLSPLLTSRPAARLIALALGLLPAAAMAHPGHYHPPGEEDEFDAISAGIMHPFSGADHILLSLAAGWIAFMPGTSKARLPFAAFLLTMMAGAWTGRLLQGVAGLEIMIAATLIVAGAIFLFGQKFKRLVITGAISAAGFVHGFAHGAEAAPQISFTAYSSGLLIGTAILMCIGYAIHRVTSRLDQPLIPRIAGGILVAAGSIALTQAL